MGGPSTTRRGKCSLLAACAAGLGLIVTSLAVLMVFLLRPSASIDDYAGRAVDQGNPLGAGQVGVTFFGVSTLLFDDGTDQVMVDAFLTRPSRLEFLSGMAGDELRVAEIIAEFGIERLRAVFVAHSHVDHALDVPAVARLTGATVHGTESTLNIGRGGGIPEHQLQLASEGDTIRVGAFTVQALETPHSTLPGLDPPAQPETIDAPLQTPASNADFAEGGNLTFVLTHGASTYVVVASANSRPGMLAGVKADVAFLSTALLGKQDELYQTAYLEETIGTVTPGLVVPLHWDDFLRPWRRGAARFNPRLIDSEPAGGIDLLIERAERAGSAFALLQAGSRIVLDG